MDKLELELDKCKGNLDDHCYCCGQFKIAEDKRYDGRFSEAFKLLYTAYFDRPVIEDKWYTPQSVCQECFGGLFQWKLSRGKEQMFFAIPMQWSEPKAKKHDPDDCYACANFIPANKKKIRHLLKHRYKPVESAKLPIDHDTAGIPEKYPDGYGPDYVSDSYSSLDEEDDDDKDESYDPGSDDDRKPELITQEGKPIRNEKKIAGIFLFASFYRLFDF